MLPFLKRKPVAGLIISQRKADGGGIEEQHSEGDENHAMKAAAEDILRAISSKDAEHLALAIQAAYDICASAEPKSDSQDSNDSNDFDSRNAAAAKEQR